MSGLDYKPDFSWLAGAAPGMTYRDLPPIAPPRPRIRVHAETVATATRRAVAEFTQAWAQAGLENEEAS